MKLFFFLCSCKTVKFLAEKDAVFNSSVAAECGNKAIICGCLGLDEWMVFFHRLKRGKLSSGGSGTGRK